MYFVNDVPMYLQESEDFTDRYSKSHACYYLGKVNEYIVKFCFLLFKYI